MDVTTVNNKLKDNYGQDLLGQPFFRIVWSEDQLEKRIGDFEDYLPGTNILIRRVREVRECKKYPFLKPQWVMEKLFFNQHNDEILDNDTLSPRTCTYEPFWAFGHEKNGRAKRPIWDGCVYLINCWMNPRKKTPSEMNDDEINEELKQQEAFQELLNTHVKNDSLHSAIEDGDAIMMNDATQKPSSVTGALPKTIEEIRSL